MNLYLLYTVAGRTKQECRIVRATNELHALHGKGLIRLLAILMVALNLRGAITCVGPLLKDIQAHFGLNGTAAGLLTSLPLFAFGFLSPYAAPLARRLGMEQAVFLAMLLLLAVMHWPAAADLLGIVPLSPLEWAASAAIGATVFVMVEVEKLARRIAARRRRDAARPRARE